MTDEDFAAAVHHQADALVRAMDKAREHGLNCDVERLFNTQGQDTVRLKVYRTFPTWTKASVNEGGKNVSD